MNCDSVCFGYIAGYLLGNLPVERHSTISKEHVCAGLHTLQMNVLCCHCSCIRSEMNLHLLLHLKNSCTIKHEYYEQA